MAWPQPETNLVNARLVLFDVDQTLIHSAGCGKRALEKALEEVLKIPNGLDGISMTGKTDTYIVFEVLEKNGKLQSLPPKKDVLLWERYVFHLRRELEISREARPAEGVPELLKRLRRNPSARLALLTGNIRRGARLKLEHFGLWGFFPVGGFGDDHMDRNILAQITLKKCREHFNEKFHPEQVYVIGDSLRDLAAARAIRAKPVITATGLDSYETLRAENPYSLFKNFRNTDAVLQALEGNPCFENSWPSGDGSLKANAG